MESVSCQLQDMYKETITQSNLNKKSISSLDSRLTRLEEHTHRIVGLLERLPVLLPPETGLITGSDENEQSRRTVSLSDVEITGKRILKKRSFRAIFKQRMNYIGSLGVELELACNGGLYKTICI